jgi:hypothetical protein
VRTILLAMALAASTAGPATAAPARPLVIQGDRAVGGVVLGRTTLPQAAALFSGHGAHRVVRHGSSCVAAWPGLGISVLFATVGTDASNPCVKAAALRATITSRAAWRTAVGLRVGDAVPRLRRLYARAALHRRAPDAGFWLVPRQVCAEVGGGAYPGLLARVRAGRVTALVARAGVCD